MDRNLQECFRYIDKDNRSAFRRIILKIRAVLCKYLLRQVEIPYVEIIVTTCCNLKCKECSQMIPYQESPVGYSFEYFKNCVDSLLKTAGYIYRLRIHGGEPFLNGDLAKMIRYAQAQKKVGSIRITTNGTVIPKEEVLLALADSRVVVKISDYRISREKQNEVLRKFDSYGIKYTKMDGQVWKKFGGFDKRESSRFKDCFLNKCACVSDGKLHVCARAAMAEKMLIINDKNAVEVVDNRSLKKDLKAFYGRRDMDICNYCDGDTPFSEVIEAGKQL